MCNKRLIVHVDYVPGGSSSETQGQLVGTTGFSWAKERESPWALTLTERVPEAFEIPPSDWPEKFFLANQRRGLS